MSLRSDAESLIDRVPHNHYLLLQGIQRVRYSGSPMVKQVTIVVAVLAMASIALSATIHVPSQQPTIQAGIDAAQSGDVVMVAPGTYTETISFGVKHGIALISSAGPDSTVIRGSFVTGGVVRFPNKNDTTSVIDGFSVRNVSGGDVGIWCDGGQTIQHCTIDSCTYGILASSGARILYNSLSDNRDLGLKWYSTDSRVAEVGFNYVSGNSASGILLYEQGAYVHHNIICSNGGYGIYGGNAVDQFANNTIVANGAGGVYTYGGTTLRNNIIVTNPSFGISAPGCTSEYNDVWGNGGINDPGFGGISQDPIFVDPGNHNYELDVNSPCIDAGDPAPQFNDPDGTRNDMGARLSSLPVVSVAVDGKSDKSHVISASPRFDWTFASPSIQTGYEIEVGTDNNWQVAEMWSPPQFSSADTFALYAGNPLIRGNTYFLRLRVRIGQLWRSWYFTSFRMNSAPETPMPFAPLVGEVVDGNPVLAITNSADAESDVVTYEFQVCADSDHTILVASADSLSGVQPRTSWATTPQLTDNEIYWWRARAFDGYEHSLWSGGRYFLVNVTQEPPSQPVLLDPPASGNFPVFDLRPTLHWVASSDPDPLDTVRYRVDLSLNSIFQPPSSYENIMADSLVLPDSLDFGTRYWWRVRAIDKTGLYAVSTPSKSFWTWTLGDMDHSHNCDIADLSRLIDYLYISFTPITPLKVADLDGDCHVDISDLTRLIDRLYISFKPLEVGCD